MPAQPPRSVGPFAPSTAEDVIRTYILEALELDPAAPPPAIAALRARFGGSTTRLVRIRQQVLAESAAEEIHVVRLSAHLQVLVDQATSAAADLARQQRLAAHRQTEAALALAKQLDRLHALLRERTSRADLSGIEARLDELALDKPAQTELAELRAREAQKDAEIARLFRLLTAKPKRRRRAKRAPITKKPRASKEPPAKPAKKPPAAKRRAKRLTTKRPVARQRHRRTPRASPRRRRATPVSHAKRQRRAGRRKAKPARSR